MIPKSSGSRSLPRVQTVVVRGANKSQLLQWWVALQSSTLSSKISFLCIHFSLWVFLCMRREALTLSAWKIHNMQDQCYKLWWLDVSLHSFSPSYDWIQSHDVRGALCLLMSCPCLSCGFCLCLSLSVMWASGIKHKQVVFYYLILKKLSRRSIIMSSPKEKKLLTISRGISSSQ